MSMNDYRSVGPTGPVCRHVGNPRTCPHCKAENERQVTDLMASERAKRRPFCNTWPFSCSDLDVVLPEANNAVHLARGCCDGFIDPFTERDSTPGAAEPEPTLTPDASADPSTAKARYPRTPAGEPGTLSPNTKGER